MKALIETTGKRTERVFLIGLELKSRSSWDLQDSLEELSELASTAGADVLGNGIQKLEAPVAATFIGTGKANEFALHCRGNGVDTVIFDDELTPAQTRNLEKVFECKVLDRTSLILDIFAQRARTREGKLQVELAQLQHLLPRLTRFWGHLSRQKGGIGMRGDGETQLETDRRRVQDRIARISEELDVVRRQRTTQRAGRELGLSRRRRGFPLGPLGGKGLAGFANHFESPHDTARILAVDNLKRHRIALFQFAQKLRQWGCVQCRAQRRVRRWRIAETIQERIEIQAGAAAQNRHPPASLNFLHRSLGAADKLRRIERLVQIDDINQVVGHTLALCRSGLGGADVESTINLHGIHGDNFAADFFSQQQGNFGFANGGRTRQENRLVRAAGGSRTGFAGSRHCFRRKTRRV